MEINKFKVTNLYFKGLIINAIPVLIILFSYLKHGGDGSGIGLAMYLLFFVFLLFFYCTYFLLKKDRIYKRKKRRIILFSPFLLSIVFVFSFAIYWKMNWEELGSTVFLYSPFFIITFIYALYVENNINKKIKKINKTMSNKLLVLYGCGIGINFIASICAYSISPDIFERGGTYFLSACFYVFLLSLLFYVFYFFLIVEKNRLCSGKRRFIVFTPCILYSILIFFLHCYFHSPSPLLALFPCIILNILYGMIVESNLSADVNEEKKSEKGEKEHGERKPRSGETINSGELRVEN